MINIQRCMLCELFLFYQYVTVNLAVLESFM